jgi:hypothetical protein
MWVAVLISGDDVAKRETDKASACKPHGRHTQDDRKFPQQAHVRHSHRYAGGPSLGISELIAKARWNAPMPASARSPRERPYATAPR